MAAGYNIGQSGGRPEGTTVASGYAVGMSSGGPEDTTVAAGLAYQVAVQREQH